jgi:hypothetical protein
MRIRLNTLQLQFRKQTELIDLTAQITFFHGPISSGKSSIARLIDYCLGGNLHATLALTQELVAATLDLSVGGYRVLLEREGLESSAVRATWSNAEGMTGAVLAPLHAGEEPVWSQDVYNLSDLLFHLAGVSPMKVRRSKRDPDSQLVRLSFRDLMWYCYLDQDHLDSSFFNLEDDSRRYKSRDVMRFIVGFYTERMSNLERELEDVVNSRIAKEEAAKQIRLFLRDLDFGTPVELGAEISKAESELEGARVQLVSLRQDHQHGTSTHFVDDLRQRIAALVHPVGRGDGGDSKTWKSGFLSSNSFELS